MNEIFKNTKVNFEKLIKYGFCKVNNLYNYSKNILENQFLLKVTVDFKGDVSTQIIDNNSNEEENEDEIDPENPSVDEPSDVTDNTQGGDKVDANAPKVDEDGNVITKLPQTGITVFQIAGVVAIVVIAGALAVRKLRK